MVVFLRHILYNLVGGCMDLNRIKKYIPTVILAIGLLFFASKYYETKTEPQLPFAQLVGTDNNSDVEVKDEREPKTILVQVAGAAVNTGIVELKEGDRVKDAIDAAGGVLSDADVDSLNLARKVKDEEKIYIPKVGEIVETHTAVSNELININKASSGELQNIPGIGPKTADKIVRYREGNPFVNIEDIKNVPGIGDKKFEEIKDFITCD